MTIKKNIITYEQYQDQNPNDTIELYTIQSLEQLNNLETNGFITGSINYADSYECSCTNINPLNDKPLNYINNKNNVHDKTDISYNNQLCTCHKDNTLTQAYQWMNQQMILQNVVSVSNNNMICSRLADKQSCLWAWYQYDSSTKRRPDLRHRGYAERGTPMVLITFKKRWKDILISDFIMWHYVLNQSIIPYNSQYQIIQNTIDKKHPHKFFSELPYNYQTQIKKSWLSIFDISYNNPDITNCFDFKALQITFWYLYTYEVTNIQKFTTR